jgi:hypothetical protein
LRIEAERGTRREKRRGGNQEHRLTHGNFLSERLQPGAASFQERPAPVLSMRRAR